MHTYENQATIKRLITIASCLTGLILFSFLQTGCAGPVCVDRTNINPQVWQDTRVFTFRKSLYVWVRIDHLTSPQDFEVWVHNKQHPIRMGNVHCTPASNGNWCQFHLPLRKINRHATLADTVSIELRALNIKTSKQQTSNQIQQVVFRRDGIQVNAPYTPAFNMDKSFAHAVQQAVSIERVKREGPDRIELGFDIHRPPVHLAYHVMTDSPTQYQLDYPFRLAVQRVKKHWIGSTIHIKPSAQTITVTLLPDPNWELRTMTNWELKDDLPPSPWGYPIVFEKIPIPQEDESGKVKIYGKVLLDHEN